METELSMDLYANVNPAPRKHARHSVSILEVCLSQ